MSDLEASRKVQKAFAIRTTNEIDELFAKVEKLPAKPGKKQAARMNKLESPLIARGNEALTFAEVGKYLELGSRSVKDNVDQILHPTFRSKAVLNKIFLNCFYEY
jgi:nucleoside-triphosphatase THEP1